MDQQQIFELIIDKDDITWETLIYDLVRSNEIDPWDVDVSLLTRRYISMIKTLKRMDFMISGKVILAAAILLKLKSIRLAGADLMALDRILASVSEEPAEDYFFEEEQATTKRIENDEPSLMLRTPQPRKRSVSVYDLIDALKKVLETKRKRVLDEIPVNDIQIPEKKRDITLVLKELFNKIKGFLSNGNKLYFTELLSNGSKIEKVNTFIPLLHLENDGKIQLYQKEAFGDIELSLA